MCQLSTEEIAHLRAENQELREALNQALAQLSEVREDLRLTQVRIEEREKQKTPPPEFVKANVKKPKAEEETCERAQPWSSPQRADADRGASDRDLSQLPVAFGRDQFGARARGD